LSACLAITERLSCILKFLRVSAVVVQPLPLLLPFYIALFTRLLLLLLLVCVVCCCVCCQFKMIMQTNINPLQVDACGCRLMALSDSPATLDVDFDVVFVVVVFDLLDSDSDSNIDCGNVPRSLHRRCGLNAVPGHNDF